MTTEKPRCSGRILDPPYYRTNMRCQNNGKHWEDGKWWCGIHAPSFIERRENKKRDERLRESRRRQVLYEHKQHRRYIERAALRLALREAREPREDWREEHVEALQRMLGTYGDLKD